MSCPKPLSLVVVMLLVACGESGTSLAVVSVVSVVVDPGNALIVGVGRKADFAVAVEDASGGTVSDASVTWEVADPGVATIDDRGTARGVSAGVTTVTASVQGVQGMAQLEVWIPEVRVLYRTDTSYFGREGYVEYIPGELPLIVSAPHGGSETPEEIRNRTYGTFVTDANTRETILAVRDALIESTGYAPHVIISHLRRTKLDPNREIQEAAQENPFAELAWEEYHEFIADARRTVTGDFGEGLYLDLHGHGHPIERLELGYLLTAVELNRTDVQLDPLSVVQLTSIRELGRVSRDRIPFSQLLRGPTSFGGYLAAQGVRSVPSPTDPGPGSDPYFSGGYSTREHGSMADSEVISGIQLELHRLGIRDTEENRAAFAARLAWTVEMFMLEHFEFFTPQ